MKQINLDKIKTWAFALLAGGFFASCSDSIDLPGVSEDPYQSSDKALAFITDKYGCSNVDSLLFSESGSTAFYVNLNKALTSSSEYTIAYDETALNNYNLAHGTTFKALPKDLVTVDGAATVASGETKSSAVKVSYTSAATLDSLGTYAIPLKVTGAGAQASTEKGEFVFFVRDITKMPNCHKANGLQVISCMEINDANPLYNLCFTLKNSGKLFFDQVILFSGNINYNAATGEVYNYNNENISQCLNYKEKYLEPLQQKGMKVILGILGNHDRAAVNNLSDAGARAFAAELKANCDAYNLDGLFFDDEYSSTGDYPGFVYPSKAAWSRLAYECKKAMPEKLIEAYVYSGTSSAVAVDGHQPGEFIDYGIQDYGGFSDLSSNYPGMKKTGMIQASVECARGYGGYKETFEEVKNSGYGGTMVFALAPNHTPMNVLNAIAQGFYGEDVVRTGTYAKDW
jgi:hypothetical protein